MTNVDCIEVKDLGRSSWLVLGTIRRRPKTMVGWKKVRYLNRYYQLFGGIRDNYFIDLSNPIGRVKY